jgi:hypothetical protein
LDFNLHYASSSNTIQPLALCKCYIGPSGSTEESNMRAAFITGYGGNSVVRVTKKTAITTWHDELAFR